MLEKKAIIDNTRGMKAIIVIIVFIAFNSSPNYYILDSLISGYEPFITAKVSIMIFYHRRNVKGDNVLVIIYTAVKMIQC